MHSNHRGCAFCMELERIAAAPGVTDEEHTRAHRADRAARARRVYGRRKGHR